jgi:putative aldouronate transport system substrate-binding protein
MRLDVAPQRFSAQQPYRAYGEKGADHTENADGDPILTTQGTSNTAVPVRYLAEAPAVLYQPGRPQDVDLQHAYQTKVLGRKPLTAIDEAVKTWRTAVGDRARTEYQEQL